MKTGESEAPDAKVCAICQLPTDVPVADHCHASGAVRDWLCRSCNAGLGMFRDRPGFLRAAAEYLERHTANPIDSLVFMRCEMDRCHPRTIQRRARRALRDVEVAASQGRETPFRAGPVGEGGPGERAPGSIVERLLGVRYVAEGRATWLALVPDRYKSPVTVTAGPQIGESALRPESGIGEKIEEKCESSRGEYRGSSSDTRGGHGE